MNIKQITTDVQSLKDIQERQRKTSIYHFQIASL